MRHFVILASALLLAGTALAQAPQRGATRAGDVHVYAIQQKAERQELEETVTVQAVEQGTIRTLHRRTGRAQDLQGLYGSDWATAVSGASGSRFDPPVKLIDLPLEPGRSWEQTHQVVAANGARSQLKVEGRVVGLEKLVTPAGEFEAWRVESKSYLSGLSWQGGFQILQKVWYAPAIDRVVRMEYRESRAMGADNVTELKSFQAAP